MIKRRRKPLNNIIKQDWGQNMKKILLLPLFLCLLLLCSCAYKPQGEYFTDEEFIKEVEKYSGTEHISILEKKEESGYIAYTIKTDQRGIVVTIYSNPAGDSGIYNPANIDEIKFIKAIHALYLERIQAMIDEIYKDNSCAVFENRSELHNIVCQIEKMDEIYKEELEYHDEEWLKEFPVTRISLSRRDTGEDKGDFSCVVNIDGTINADELEEYICNQYKERTGKELEN